MATDDAQRLEDTSSYPFDVENVAEMARINRQARFTTTLTDLLPAAITPAGRVLDIGCGPGEWVLSLAERFPTLTITGIDISQMMTTYALYLAQEHQLHNVSFQQGDVRTQLPFPDATFDLVHARFLTGALTPQSWPKLLAEVFRVLRPGGHFVDVETEGAVAVNSPSLFRTKLYMMEAVYRAGHSFTEGENFGITAVQGKLFQGAGFVHIQREAFALDCSSGAPAHDDIVQDWIAALTLGSAFVTSLTSVSPEDFTALTQRAIEEMQSPDFSGIMFLQRMWGTRA